MVLIGLEVFSLAALRADRADPHARALDRGGAQVLPARRVLVGVPRLRHGPALRRDRARSTCAASRRGRRRARRRCCGSAWGSCWSASRSRSRVVPFHHWVPDVYQGAPTNVTGFMAAATKTAAFAVLLRFLVGAFGDSRPTSGCPLVTVLAILTMTVANLVALAQTNLKRLLAFSSIAHAGLPARSPSSAAPTTGSRRSCSTSRSYALMTVGAFAVLGAVGRGDAEGERGYDALRLGRAGLAPSGARGRADAVPVLLGRDPADRRLLRQVRDLPLGRASRAVPPGHRRRAQRRDRRLLLPARARRTCTCARPRSKSTACRSRWGRPP